MDAHSRYLAPTPPDANTRLLETGMGLEPEVLSLLDGLGANTPEGLRVAAHAVFLWLFLLDLDGIGAEVTLGTAQALATRLFEGDTSLVGEALSGGIELGLFAVREDALRTTLPGPGFLGVLATADVPGTAPGDATSP